MSNIYIREASIEDCKTISEIHVKSWLETYDEIIPNSFLSKVTASEREKSWLSNFSKEELAIFVAIADKNIVGFSSIAPRSYKGNREIFLESIYLLQSFHNLGIGKNLFHKSISHAREYGYNSIFIEVLADNSALNFYLHFSATIIEEKKIKIGGKDLSEYILRMDLRR